MRKVLAAFSQGSVRRGLQGKFYKALAENRTDTWQILLQTRVTMYREGLTPAPDRWFYSDSLTQSWPMVVRSLSVSCVMIVLKTWANAWCTTTRYHEAIVWPCIFSCDGAEDSLRHYINCPHLWSRVTASPWTHVDPTVRLGLDRPTPLRLKFVAVASKCYHATKFGHRGAIELAVTSGDYAPVLHILQTLATLFRQELGVT